MEIPLKELIHLPLLFNTSTVLVPEKPIMDGELATVEKLKKLLEGKLNGN
jgi:hypothetical protein